MKTALFDYDLPPELIAQTPTARRDQSRLLVVDRTRRTVAHHVFAELPDLIGGRYALFRNNANVIPARLFAQRPSGGRVECFLHQPAGGGSNDWWCLLRPGRKLPPGATFGRAGWFSATVIEKHDERGYRVTFSTPAHTSIVEVAHKIGEVPLPPYIARDPSTGGALAPLDRDRYRTHYADRAKSVAVAAPTAGLHFTPEIDTRLAAAGAQFFDVTLHVGLGTFKPIQTDDIEAHQIHRELYDIPTETQAALFAHPGRRLAVGTTSVRTIEDFLRKHAGPTGAAVRDEAALFLHPPAEFRGIDALITNFHQPRSTLLCLVAAFLSPGSTDGITWLRELYAEAIASRYRFFSYGDAMLIL
ncbi:MAG TPA: tRNA preQ1(34) S-adenosylmethionine ribosyltransferase-isomerase QueA [Opitutaceae bacterium]|nr:tRNA preQ1(34) S-adenosylmethionine ribosyltransferase-isomerase QueA [Opitutaceae bacterium]